MELRKRLKRTTELEETETPPSKRARTQFDTSKKTVKSAVSSTKSRVSKPIIIDLVDKSQSDGALTKPANSGRRVVRARVQKAKEQTENLYTNVEILDDEVDNSRNESNLNACSQNRRDRPRKKIESIENEDAMDIDEPLDSPESPNQGADSVIEKKDEPKEKEKLSDDLAEAVELPEEIWDLIFNRIDQGRLSVLPRVCKTWYKILSRDSYWIRDFEVFNFHATVGETEDFPLDFPLQNPSQLGYVPKNLVYTYDEEEESEAEIYTFGCPPKKRKYTLKASVHSIATIIPGHYYQAYGKGGQLLGIFEIAHPRASIHTIKTLLDTVLNPKAPLPEVSLAFEPFEPVREYDYYLSRSVERVRFKAIMKLNIRMLDREVMQKKNLKQRARFLPILYERAANHVRRQFIGGHFTSMPCIPSLNHSLAKQPKGLTGQLKLHAYQLDAVGWMKNIESMVAAGHQIEYFGLFRDVLGASQYYIAPNGKDTYTFYFRGENEVADRRCIRKLGFKGGIFADEMGLGKTLTLLGLTLEDDYVRPDCLIREKTEMSKLNPGSVCHLFETKATLVLCPNHVSKQWVEEIQKSVANPKIVYLTTKPQHTSTTYADIFNADYVVVTEPFLVNRQHYFFLNRPPHITLSAGEAIRKRIDWMRDEFIRLSNLPHDTKEKTIKAKSAPYLEFFHWRRIVLDEGHELLRNSEIGEMLKTFNADFKWYMTGTPFPDYETLKRVQIFLELDSTDPEWYLDLNRRRHSYLDPQSPSHTLVNAAMIDNLFWRNMKSSVKDSFSVPDTVEQHVLLDFTDIERALYETHKNDATAIRHICMTPIARYGRYTGDFAESMARVDGYADDEDYKYYLSMVSLDSDDEAGLPPPPDSYSVFVGREYRRQYQEREKAIQKVRIAKAKRMAAEAREKKLNSVHEEVMKLSKPEERGYLNTVRTDNMLAFHRHLLETLDRILEIRAEVESTEHKLHVQERKYPRDDDEIHYLTGRLKREKESLDTVEKLRDWLIKCNETWAKSVPMKVPRLLERQYRNDDKDDEPFLSNLTSHPAYPSTSDTILDKVEKPKEEEKKSVLSPDALQIDSTSIKREVPEEIKAQFDALVFNHGTKMASLILYLRKVFAESDEHRVILFSQNISFLQIVRNFLKKNEIESVFVEGNVMTKTKALREFKAPSSKVRVILLSIDKAASGTNLIAASHVILLDPAYGSSGAAAAKESQAIGRAYRQGQKKSVVVVRFAIRNTIEHEYLLRNNEDLDESDVKDVFSLFKNRGLDQLGVNIRNLVRMMQDSLDDEDGSDIW